MIFDVAAVVARFAGRIKAGHLGFPDEVDGMKHFESMLRGHEASVVDGGAIIAHPTARLANGGKTIVSGEGSALVLCDKALTYDTSITIRGKGALVIIGPRTRIRRLHLDVSGDGATFLWGADSTFEGGGIQVNAGDLLAAGQDCMFSAGIMARTSDGHGIFDRESREQVNLPGDIIFGDHVWVGNSCRIGKGITIGSGAVIGQNAIVTKDIEANTVNVGVPARSVRENVVWSRTGSYDDVPDVYR